MVSNLLRSIAYACIYIQLIFARLQERAWIVGWHTLAIVAANLHFKKKILALPCDKQIRIEYIHLKIFTTQAVKAHRGSWGLAPVILDLGIGWTFGSPCYRTPRTTSPGTHKIGKWVGLTSSFNFVEKRKISCLYQDPNPGPSSP